MNKKCLSYLLGILLSGSCFTACNNTKAPPKQDIAATPEQLKEKTTETIRTTLAYAAENNGDMGDSTRIDNLSLIQKLYEDNQFNAVWSVEDRLTPAADSLSYFLQHANLYGLFPEDYHYYTIDSIAQRFANDTLGKGDRSDAVLHSKADLLLSNALLHMIRDVKLGRLPNDSVTLRKDSVITDEFYITQFNAISKGASISQLLNSLEPKHEGYQLLKAGIPQFLSKSDNREFTKVPLPKQDTLNYRTLLQKRLYEGGYITFDSIRADSAQLADAVKQFQKDKNITVDGKAGEGTIRILNTTDKDRFVRIAISMDRYKMLPEQLPAKYIWVNIPSFSMKLQDGDSVKLVSKIICGKPLTRTPILTSAVSEIITYPQWTPPNSIIIKEILPAAKRDPGYFAKRNFSLLDKDGNEVDPYTVEWSRYSKGIPYKVVQGSGDANALGILKFNFPNKYAVYLHDTNQRYLFGQTVRSLSHGCVRVQEWEKLAHYLIRNDRPEDKRDKVPMIDSMNSWIERKEKHSIPVKSRFSVFIRYFTCEGKDGGIAFYDDIYGEDKRIRERYFAGK